MSQPRMNTKLFGIVIKQDLENLSQEEKTEKRKEHFLSKEIIYKLLEEIMPHQINHYVIAHEHGEEDDTCHYQCCVQLQEPIRTRITEYKKNINGINIYILYQKGKKNLDALVKYCKKDGDYICSPEIEKKSQHFIQKLKEAKNRKEELSIILDTIPKDAITRDLPKMLDNIAFIKDIEDEEPIKITFPEYLIEREPFLFEWYMTQMVGYPQDYKGRRKALVLFSKERCMGKTTFAKSLVNFNEKNYIICRNSFTSIDFNKYNAKLLILDDVTYITKQQEMWKALVTSEKTSIRDAYTNIDFTHGLPTIITTNNYSMFTFMLSSDYFKYDCKFCWVQNYLGPEGTNPRSCKRKIDTNFELEELTNKYGEPKKKIHFTDEEEEIN